MKRHSFDVISAILGVVAVVVGLLVSLDRINLSDGDVGWWLAFSAFLFGVAMIPWGRRHRLTVMQPGDTLDTLNPQPGDTLNPLDRADRVAGLGGSDRPAGCVATDRADRADTPGMPAEIT